MSSFTCGRNGWHDAVHFNRGRHGHVWICITCGKTKGRVKLDETEKQVLIEFAKHFRQTIQEKKSTARKEHLTEESMKLELAILAGAESKQFLVDFTKQIDRLEKLSGAATGKKTAAPAIDDDEPEDVPEASADADDDEDFAPKKKSAKAKAAAAFEDDEDDAGEVQAAAEADDDDEDFTAPPAKKAPAKKAAAPKAKKLTMDDVNDACKARAKKTNRADVLAILKKKFKTDSVTNLEPEQYAQVIAAMEA